MSTLKLVGCRFSPRSGQIPDCKNASLCLPAWPCQAQYRCWPPLLLQGTIGGKRAFYFNYRGGYGHTVWKQLNLMTAAKAMTQNTLNKKMPLQSILKSDIVLLRSFWKSSLLVITWRGGSRSVDQCRQCLSKQNRLVMPGYCLLHMNKIPTETPNWFCCLGVLNRELFCTLQCVQWQSHSMVRHLLLLPYEHSRLEDGIFSEFSRKAHGFDKLCI